MAFIVSTFITYKHTEHEFTRPMECSIIMNLDFKLGYRYMICASRYLMPILCCSFVIYLILVHGLECVV